jgi:hypothetical protein
VIAARREPLIWLQLLGAAALPLEALLILLLLADADPGPVPALERLLAWAIGGLAPAVLLWKRPADPFSLLLVQVPLRARSLPQRTLSGSPLLGPRLAGAAAAILLLPALWWIDAAAALAGPMALLPDASRLVALLLSVPVLAAMVWQLQQLVQAVGLLVRPTAAAADLTPLSIEQIEAQRLCLGLPLLLLDPLAEPPQPTPPAADKPAFAPAEPQSQSSGPVVEVDTAVAVEPEQPAEEHDGPHLDQEIG